MEKWFNKLRIQSVTKLTVTILFLFISYSAYGQLSGIKTIPGDYATIEAAIAALNTQGVGAGGVTFNVTAGHTETFSTDSAGFITATGTLGNEIIFQKSGAGANPLITASGLGSITTSTSLTANGDGIIIIEGGDYITFDGIDLQENLTAVDAQLMESGYFLKKVSGDDACKNVTIRNCSISLDKATRYSYGIYVSNLVGSSDATVTSTGGRSENIKIHNCTISNVYVGIQLRGDAASTPYDLYDHNIELGVDGPNSITNYGGGSSSAYGVYAIYQNNLKIANTTINGGAGTTTTLYGIFTSTGNNSNADIYNNTVTIEGGATTSSIYAINNSLGSSGTDNTVNIYNNIIENSSYPTATSGSMYCLYQSASAFNANIYDNIIRNNTKDGASGSMYLLYSFNTGANGFANVYSNEIYNNTNNAGTGDLYCLYSNEVSTSTKMIYDNSIYTNTGQDDLYGLFSVTGALVHINNNSIYDNTSNTTLSSSPYNSGIVVSTGTDIYVYNNFISDLKAPNSAATDAVRGISFTSATSNATRNVYYNTIFLNASSTGTDFGSSGIYHTYSATATSSTLDMRNNNIVNNSTPNGTGLSAAFRRSSATSLVNYSEMSNNNNFYAGTPGASNLLYYDGTNSVQTIGELQVLADPRESASVSGNPPFVNITTAPYNLHIDTATPTQLESAGTPITSPVAVNEDFDGDTRNATTPDIGADEFNGIGADLTPPLISYTNLPNVNYAAASVSLTATITDAGGVAGGSNLPRLYIKKTTDVSYVFDNNPGVSGDDYTFTIAYTAIGGISIGDTIEYYVAAQDIPGNAGTNPAGGSGSNPPGTTPPSVPNRYIVIDDPLSGNYTVGLTLFKQLTGKEIDFETRTRTVTKNINGIDAVEDINISEDEKNNPIKHLDLSPKHITVNETYTVMVENGKPFNQDFFRTPESRGIYPTITAAVNDLVLRGVSGPVTFSLVDASYPNETYPILISDVNGSSSTNTVTIKPASGIQTVITGSESQPTSAFQLGGADYVIIDGSNTVGGTTKDLHITSQTGSPAFHFYGESNHNIVKNIVFESENTSTGSGTFLFGASASGDSNYVENCTMKSSDTVATRHGVGVYFFSSNTSTGNSIVGCDIINFNSYGLRLQGAPSTNTFVSGCDVYMTEISTGTSYGAYVSRVDGLIIEKSKFRNLTGSTVRGIYLVGSSASGDFIIRNNFISLSSVDNISSGTVAGLDYFGFAANSMEAYHNSIYIGGTEVTGTTTTYAFTKRDEATIYKAYNNAVYTARSNGTGTGPHYAVYVSDTNTVTFEIDYNDYFADGVGGVMGFYQGPGAIADLATWQTTTGLDANSLSANPGFTGMDDLHILSNSNTLDAKGLFLASVPDDIDGEARNMTTPDIGADEYTYVGPIFAPSDLLAVADTFSVELFWTDNSDNETGFVVERKPGDSTSANPYTIVDTAGANAVTYLNTGLTPNTMYTFRVKAINQFTESGYSNQAEVQTKVPVELASFSASISGREIRLNWSTASEINNKGFEIERKLEDKWEKIGFVEGKGTTSETQDYGYSDKFDYKSFLGMVSYRLKNIDFDGSYNYSTIIEIEVDFTPKEYSLYQNYPNPFNPNTTIKYALPFDSNVKIGVYNLLGELVVELVNKVQATGYYDAIWNAGSVASGTYFYVIQANSTDGTQEFKSVKKMLFVK